MDTDTKDETANTNKEQEGGMSSDDHEKKSNEEKKQKLLQIRGATSIYGVKLLALVVIATIVTVTASDFFALLLGALTFFATIVLDMAVLGKENPVWDIWQIYLAHWFITSIFSIVAVGDLLLIILYDYVPLEVETYFVWTVRLSMYIMGIFGPIIEIYYNIPYDD